MKKTETNYYQSSAMFKYEDSTVQRDSQIDTDLAKAKPHQEEEKRTETESILLPIGKQNSTGQDGDKLTGSQKKLTAKSASPQRQQTHKDGGSPSAREDVKMQKGGTDFNNSPIRHYSPQGTRRSGNSDMKLSADKSDEKRGNPLYEQALMAARSPSYVPPVDQNSQRFNFVTAHNNSLVSETVDHNRHLRQSINPNQMAVSEVLNRQTIDNSSNDYANTGMHATLPQDQLQNTAGSLLKPPMRHQSTQWNPEDGQGAPSLLSVANPISQGDMVSRMQMQRSYANDIAKGINPQPDQMNMATSIDSQSSLALYQRKLTRNAQQHINVNDGNVEQPVQDVNGKIGEGLQPGVAPESQQVMADQSPNVQVQQSNTVPADQQPLSSPQQQQKSKEMPVLPDLLKGLFSSQPTPQAYDAAALPNYETHGSKPNDNSDPLTGHSPANPHSAKRYPDVVGNNLDASTFLPENTPEKLDKRNLDEEQETIDYQMISQLFDYEQICEADEFAIKRTKNTLYKGTLIDRKRQGLGVLIYENGRVYEGEWQDDRRNGRGYELFSNQSKYIGQYLNNKAHGKGIFTWPNGEVYDGEWQQGIKQGFGIWKGNQGDSYIGEWRNGKVNGYGVHQWKNGDRYEGEWENSLKSGKGTDIYANGDSYTGDYQVGKPHGFGNYKWKNGASYVGNFANGLKDGAGKWKKDSRPNCNQYDGVFFNDMKNGYGIFQWESGNRYEGNYLMDLREGWGRMDWNDGSYYEGYWSKGLQCGQGRLVLPDGRVKEGLFRNNKFQGAMKLPRKTQVHAIAEEDENDEALQGEAQSDYIPPLQQQAAKPIIGQGGPGDAQPAPEPVARQRTSISKKMIPERPQPQPFIPDPAEEAAYQAVFRTLNQNEKKESKGHDSDRKTRQHGQGRMFASLQQADGDPQTQGKPKVDHEIDLDSEPHHSELHEDNKELAQQQYEYELQQQRRRERSAERRRRHRQKQIEKAQVQTSSSFYKNHSPSNRSRHRSSSSEFDINLIQKREDDVPKYESPRKPVQKREPKGRDFQGVQNKKVNVSNVGSRVDTGRNRGFVSRPAAKKKKVSPRKSTVDQSMDSYSVSLAKQQSIDNTKSKRRKSKRKSPAQSRNQRSDSLLSGSDIVNSRSPSALQSSEQINNPKSPSQSPRSPSPPPYARANTFGSQLDTIQEPIRKRKLPRKSPTKQTVTEHGGESNDESQEISDAVDKLNMNIDLTAETMTRKVKTKDTDTKPTTQTTKPPKGREPQATAKEQEKQKEMLDRIESNFAISKQHSEEAKHSPRSEQHQAILPGKALGSAGKAKPDQNSQAVNEERSSYGTEFNERQRQKRKKNQERDEIELDEYAPPSESEQAKPADREKRRRSTRKKHQKVESESEQEQSSEEAEVAREAKKVKDRSKKRPLQDNEDIELEEYSDKVSIKKSPEKRKKPRDFELSENDDDDDLVPPQKAKRGVRNSLQVDKLNPLSQHGRQNDADTMSIPANTQAKKGKSKRQEKQTPAEYESMLSSPRIISAKPKKLRKDSHAMLLEQQERQEKLKQINRDHDSRVESPALQRHGIKLPKISAASPFNKKSEASPMSLNDGLESSMLSYKKRAVPKRPKDNVSQVMSPHGQNDYASRMSALSSNLDIDPPSVPNRRKRKIPTGRNLPKINQSVIVQESSKKRELSPKQMQSTTKARSRNRRPERTTQKAQSSNLSSSLLRKIQTDSNSDQEEEAGDLVNLAEIKEARMASRKAIDLMMKGIKKAKPNQIWVPTGDQSTVFHSNVRASPSPKITKAKF